MKFEFFCAFHESFIIAPWNGFMKGILMNFMNSMLGMIHEHSWHSWMYRFFMNVISPGVSPQTEEEEKARAQHHFSWLCTRYSNPLNPGRQNWPIFSLLCWLCYFTVETNKNYTKAKFGLLVLIDVWLHVLCFVGCEWLKKWNGERWLMI